MSMSANGVSISTAPPTRDSAGDTKTVEKVQPSTPEHTEGPAATVEISPEAKHGSS